MIQCSEVETKLGQADKQFQEKVQAEFITPLKAFLEVDIKAAVVRRKDAHFCPLYGAAVLLA